MSSNFLDAGDFQRLDRESQLLEQRERIPIEPDRTPEEEPENPAVTLIMALADLLSDRGI